MVPLGRAVDYRNAVVAEVYLTCSMIIRVKSAVGGRKQDRQLTRQLSPIGAITYQERKLLLHKRLTWCFKLSISALLYIISCKDEGA